MNKNIKNILKEKIKVFQIKKTYNKLNIIKSITQNNNVIVTSRLYCNYTLKKKGLSGSWLSRMHKVCLLSGKRGGVSHKLMLSRYVIKNLILLNKCTNISQSKK